MSDAHRDEIAKLEALYEENPEGRVFTHLAEAYRKAGDLDRAREVLVAGIERHPDYSSAHVVLGRVLRDLDRGGEAESEFLRVLDLDNHNLIALRALGDLARDRGDQPTALSYYERLVELEPSDEVREAIAELTSGPTGDADGGADEIGEAPEVDPWGAVPAEHERAASAGEPEAFAEAGHEAMDIGEPYGDGESAGEEATDEPDWSTEAEPDLDADYGGWVGGGPEDQRGDAVFDEGDSGDVEAPEADEPSAGELAMGGGPWVSGAPDESPDEADAADADDAAGVTTETIAQVYARQGLYQQAADVYRELLRTRPDDEGLRDRLAEMEQLAAAREERPADEPVAVSDGEDGDIGLEGFEVEEVDLGAADAEPISGLEVQDADPDTGLIVEASPGHANVAEPAEPWAESRDDEAERPAEEESETLGSVWTGSDWGEDDEAETPHAWAEDEAEPDDSPPIREYFGGLLSWSGGGTEAGIDAAEAEPAAPEEAGEPAPAPEAAPADVPEATEPSGSGPREDEDDDDLDMFRSWLESLKQ